MPEFMQECADKSEDKCCDENNSYVSITEAAKINKVTRQAIYIAIKLGKLKAKKESTRWTIHVDDLEEYRKQKYSRSKSTFEGELLFDNNRGYFSVNQVARMLKVPAQKIYYATRIGYMKLREKVLLGSSIPMTSKHTSKITLRKSAKTKLAKLSVFLLARLALESRHILKAYRYYSSIFCPSNVHILSIITMQSASATTQKVIGCVC